MLIGFAMWAKALAGSVYDGARLEQDVDLDDPDAIARDNSTSTGIWAISYEAGNQC